MNVVIKAVENQAELEEVFRLRYKVFVEDMHYFPPTAEGTIYDKHDFEPTTRNFVAVLDNKIVAGVRGVIVNGGVTPVDDFFCFRPYMPRGNVRLIAGGMLWVSSEYRRVRSLASLLLMRFHEYALKSGMTHVVGVAAPVAEKLLLNHNYNPILPRFYHREKQLWVLPVTLDLSEVQAAVLWNLADHGPQRNMGAEDDYTEPSLPLDEQLPAVI